MTKLAKYYVEAVIGRGRKVVSYGVFDCVNGIVSEHANYEVNEKQTAEIALHLANTHRDDLNAGLAP
jgi:hypothetical protein